MTSGTYTDKQAERLHNERDLLMSESFYPGEFGIVVLLGVASLLLWSLAMWGISH